VAVYVFIARPLVSLIATRGLGFDWNQRIFIGAVAPRGIVAAATASLFAINLTKSGVNFPQLVPMVFLVIIATVGIYGLSAPVLARKLKLSQPGRDAVAVVGDQPWIADLTSALYLAGCSVMLIAPGEEYIQKQADSGEVPYHVYTGSLAELSDEEIVDNAHEFKERVRWLIIATPDHDRIKLATDSFSHQLGHHGMIIFGRSRARQDELIFAEKASDILINTPFGLFGRYENELLDILETGGKFEVISASKQPEDGGVPEGTKPFLRVLNDGTLAVPGSVSRLED
jgi:hypothetical protein